MCWYFSLPSLKDAWHQPIPSELRGRQEEFLKVCPPYFPFISLLFTFYVIFNFLLQISPSVTSLPLVVIYCANFRYTNYLCQNRKLQVSNRSSDVTTREYNSIQFNSIFWKISQMSAKMRFIMIIWKHINYLFSRIKRKKRFANIYYEGQTIAGSLWILGNSLHWSCVCVCARTFNCLIAE